VEVRESRQGAGVVDLRSPFSKLIKMQGIKEGRKLTGKPKPSV
jgi:hypothetical protein